MRRDSRSVAAEAKFRLIARERGFTVVGEWAGSRNRIEVTCPQGHSSKLFAQQLLYTANGCSCCAKNNPKTAEARVRQIVESSGGVFLGPYLGSRKPLLIRCSAGHLVKPLPLSIVKGQGLCCVCAGRCSETSEREFMERVVALGGAVLGEYVRSDTPVLVECPRGHRVMPRPAGLRNGGGLCRKCRNLVWDVLYVVRNHESGHIKFGVTSGDPEGRLSAHRTDGFRDVLFVRTGLADDIAYRSEQGCLEYLRERGYMPVRGREYFDGAALNDVMQYLEQTLQHATARAARTQ
jgi:hypothetical protein